MDEKNFENYNEENNTKVYDIDMQNEAEDENDKTVKKNGFLKELYEWTQAIAVAVVLALVINQFVFAIVEVNGSSMEPTLQNAERLFVRKLFYQPDNQDIVIVKSDVMGKYLVKRVIATEGQLLDIDPYTGDVYVDGNLLDEPYIAEKIRDVGMANEFPLSIPQDCSFVMGDNRNNSLDSRVLGVIENNDIIGKASFRIWPFDSFGGLYGDLK